MGNKHIGSPSPDVLKVGTNRVDLLQVDLTSSLQAKRILRPRSDEVARGPCPAPY